MSMASSTNPFEVFLKEAPVHSGAYMEMTGKLGAASVLDPKTQALICLAVLSVTRLESSLPWHVQHAKSLGVTRAELIDAMLSGLPAVGNIAVQALPVAMEVYDQC